MVFKGEANQLVDLNKYGASPVRSAMSTRPSVGASRFTFAGVEPAVVVTGVPLMSIMGVMGIINYGSSSTDGSIV